MKMRKFFMWVTVIFMAVLFLGVSVSGAVESAKQYKSVYPGGYKTVHNPADWTTNVEKLGFPAVKDRVSLAVFCPQNQMIGVVARLGFPPQCAYDPTNYTPSEDYFYGLPWLSAADFSGGSLQMFRNNDIRIRNHSGTIPIVKDYSPSSDGEWLYVKVLYDGTAASNLAASNFEVTIDTDAYKAWYATASWDSSGNPLPNGKTPTGTGDCSFESTGEGGVPTDDGDDNSDNPFAPLWPGDDTSDDPPDDDTNTSGYTITAYKTGSGTVSPSDQVTVDKGGSQTFTFNPSTGWRVDDVNYGPVGGERESAGAVTSYTFSNVQQDMELGVVFKEGTDVVEETAYVASSGFPLYSVTIQEGEILTFKPTLEFVNPPAESVLCYVAYIKDGKMYVAQQGLDGEITFERYLEGDPFTSYGTHDFKGGILWECTAFEDIGLFANLLSSADVAIFCAVAAQGDLATLQGSLFTFNLD
ncbi:MAG: hypothetical protein JRJ85_13695 [Deltaproteobacteria bacterium]|nr:hypothetical protein [Deltaproteobacteria bacterium]